MGGICSCFDGGESADAKQQRREEAEELLSSEEARSNAAAAAERRQQDFEKSAAGRAARAQMAAMAKPSANANKGNPVLKWQMS